MIKLKKCKVIAALAVMSVTMMLGGVKAYALSSDTGLVGGKYVYVSSTAFQYYANGTTQGQEQNSGVYCEVSSTYIATNIYTGESITVKRSSSGIHSAQVSFSAPTDYQTVSIASDHVASYGGATYTQSTFDSFP